MAKRRKRRKHPPQYRNELPNGEIVRVDFAADGEWLAYVVQPDAFSPPKVLGAGSKSTAYGVASDYVRDALAEFTAGAV